MIRDLWRATRLRVRLDGFVLSSILAAGIGLFDPAPAEAAGTQVTTAQPLATLRYTPFYRNSLNNCGYPGGVLYPCWVRATALEVGQAVCASGKVSFHSVVVAPENQGPAGQAGQIWCVNSEGQAYFSGESAIKECSGAPPGAEPVYPPGQGWQEGIADTTFDGGRVDGYFSASCRVTKRECAAGYTPSGGSCVPTAQVVQLKERGIPEQCCANPIEPASGNKYQHEVDYRGWGAFPLEFARTYNSSVVVGYRNMAPALTVQWLHTYEREIRLDANTATVSRPDGKSFFFVLSGSTWVPDSDVADKLERLTDGGGTPTGWRYTAADGDLVETYNTAGRLVSIANRAGLVHTLTYSTAATPPAIAPGRDLLITVADAFGRTLSLTYDAFRRIATLTDPAGGQYLYAYDNATSTLVSVTYPGGVTRLYHYEDPNAKRALTGITDETGRRFSTYAYDSQARANLSEHAGGTNHTALVYNTDGSASATDALAVTRTYAFQTVLGVRRYTALSGSPCPTCGPAAQSFDANGNTASRTDWNANRTCHEYDTLRNLELVRGEGLTGACPAGLSSWTPSGAPGSVERKRTTEWHATFRLPTKLCEPKRITTLAYDTKGNLTSRSIAATNDAQGAQGCSASPVGTARTWTFTYTYSGTNPGLPIQIVVNGPRTDLTDTTTFLYQESTGNLLSVTNAKGHLTTFADHDAHGKPRQITDANGLVTTLTFDGRQRLTSRTIGSEANVYSYDNIGQLTRVTFADSSFVEYVYDAAHRVTEVRDNLGNKVVFTLDAMGNRTREDTYDQGGTLVASRTREYNSLNRKTKDIGGSSPATQIVQYGFDNQGNLTSVDGPLGGSPNDLSILGYDALNRLKQVTDALSGLTKYGYDALDRLASVTDPRTLATTYTVSGLDDETQEVSTDRGTTNRLFNAAGLATSATDARGKTTTYTYDALNRLTKDNFATGTDSTYEYDGGTAGAPNAKGRLTKIVDEAATTTWTYTSQGRVATKTQVTGSNTLSVTYGYDASGRLNAITYPSGKVVGRTFDAAGRVASITVGSTTILSAASWFPFGAVKGFTWGNGTAYSRTFDADGRVKTFPVGTSTRTIVYDDAGRITWITDSGTPSLNLNAGYDVLDRLTSYIGYPANQSYSYDANGNRTGVTIEASSYPYTVATTSNRLTATAGPAPAKTHSFDAAGNITADGTQTFVYSDRGRMASTTRGSNTVTYKYNALGQRLRKQGPTSLVTSGTNRFVYDEEGKLLGEYQNNGTVIQEYVYLGTQPVAILRGTTASPSVFYVYADHLDTPRLVTNTSNQARWRWDSAPFGDIPPNENPAGLGVFTLNLRFPGQYFDKETGLAYNGARDYDPGTGRYIQSDPIGLRGGLNTYLYVDGNPVSYSDPEGLQRGGIQSTWPTPYIAPRSTSGPSQNELMQGLGRSQNPTLNPQREDPNPLRQLLNPPLRYGCLVPICPVAPASPGMCTPSNPTGSGFPPYSTGPFLSAPGQGPSPATGCGCLQYGFIQ
jgi:RHS repeat-associated protein